MEIDKYLWKLFYLNKSLTMQDNSWHIFVDCQKVEQLLLYDNLKMFCFWGILF